MNIPRSTSSQDARLVLVASGVVTGFLYVVPYGQYAAYPLMLLSTLVHEMGHGVAAIVVDCRFDRLVIWPDGSGAAAHTCDAGPIRHAVIAAGGLLGPAVGAALAFAGGRTARGARGALHVLAVILLLALVFVVRNLFGALFVSILLGGSALAAYKGTDRTVQLLVVFLGVQLALSVFSRADYLFTPTHDSATGAIPSDVATIAAALFLPYWFWGFACGAISVAAVAYGIKVLWVRGPVEGPGDPPASGGISAR